MPPLDKSWKCGVVPAGFGVGGALASDAGDGVAEDAAGGDAGGALGYEVGGASEGAAAAAVSATGLTRSTPKSCRDGFGDVFGAGRYVRGEVRDGIKRVVEKTCGD